MNVQPQLDRRSCSDTGLIPNPDTVTDVPLRLPANEHYHTLFCGDTGFGKSVAAQRLVVESTRAWGLRTVVLDFGRHGWRRLANVPDLEGRVTVRQLEANGAWPLRWNPLQLGRRIDPEGQCRMFADIFCAIVGLDDVAAEELHNVLHACYRAAGVLVHDPATRADSQWATVGTVAEALGLDATARLTALEPADCQRVAVRRSQGIGFADLLAALRKAEPREYSRRDQRRRQQLERHLSVLSHAPHGSPYAPGSDVRDICELVPRPGGVTILEAGLPMDPTAGAFLLGWAGWQIHQDAHQDAVAQSLGGSGFKSADLQFVFEDAERIVHRVVSEGLILNKPV